ncbi:nuclease-related domain-containing protein [Nonomuraea typhae]|uniref:Nuclease-related domain-containing protein n=1 Tax=Nonomuraea typhae TaxID=2603600 RepID=A0ABW7YSP7_9ACTN
MPGGSIYVQQDAKFTGASPQWYYEKYWREDTRTRRRNRAIMAAVGFAIGLALAIRFNLPFSVAYALGLAALVAAADWYWHWSKFRATAVWRGRRRGETITGKLLRSSLGKHGYRILDGRSIRGQASIDHLVIGPGGVWIIDNESWSPDTEIATYGGRLFFGEKFGTKVATGLVDTGNAFAGLLTKETGIPVAITPMVAVHCGLMPRGGLVSAEGLTLLKPRLAARMIRATSSAAYSSDQVETLARIAARELQRI